MSLGYWLLTGSFVRPFSGDMTSKLTRRKKKKELPEDDGINLSLSKYHKKTIQKKNLQIMLMSRRCINNKMLTKWKNQKIKKK